MDVLNYPLDSYRSYEVRAQRSQPLPVLPYLVSHFPWLDEGDWLHRLQKGLLWKQNQRTGSFSPLTPQDSLLPNWSLWLPVFIIPEPDRRKEDPTYDLISDLGDLFVISKRAGVLTHPCGRYQRSALRRDLHLKGFSQVKFVHRLDRETSGCLMGARSSLLRRELCQFFEKGQVTKVYLALTKSHQKRTAGDCLTVQGRICSDESSAIRMKLKLIDTHLKNSLTHFQLLNSFQGYHLWLCFPQTGKTNQIRVHLQFLQEWIVGDKVYFPDESLFLDWFHHQSLSQRQWEQLERPHQLLHAWRLIIPPSSMSERKFEAALPETWRAFEPFQACWKGISKSLRERLGL